MALTNNNIEMIKAIAKNDIYTARKAALASLAEDNSKKNAWVTDYYRKQLIGNASILMSNIPNDMQTILVGETPSGFDERRYYVRESEEQVVSDVIKMKRISDEMSARHIPYKNTALLYGQSGTGKTELGKYIAYRLNLPFFYISFTSAIDSYMGSTAKNIHKVFEFCSSIPCVLMLDEVDCVATKRTLGGSKGVDGELERTTISIMQELDKLPNHVTLIAATNRLDMVDEAMMRRFSVKHEIKNMTKDELEGLAKQFIEATDTEKYVDKQKLSELINSYSNPGQLMPELIKIIGLSMYEEKKDVIEEEIANEDDNKINLWEVTYTWKMNISAENEEDAIAIGRNERNKYNVKGYKDGYTAKRAEFIYTPEEKKK